MPGTYIISQVTRLFFVLYYTDYHMFFSFSLLTYAGLEQLFLQRRLLI